VVIVTVILYVFQLCEGFAVDMEEAIQQERKETADKMTFLETKYTQLSVQLTCLQPVLSQFVESYILLQKEVKHFPKLIHKTVAHVTKQVKDIDLLRQLSISSDPKKLDISVTLVFRIFVCLAPAHSFYIITFNLLTL